MENYAISLEKKLWIKKYSLIIIIKKNNKYLKYKWIKRIKKSRWHRSPII